MGEYIHGNVTIESRQHLTLSQRQSIFNKWREHVGRRNDVYYDGWSDHDILYTVTVTPIEIVSKGIPDHITPAACYDCGRLYGDEHGFPDLVVDDDIWEQLMPGSEGGGLLCPSCMCKRAHDLGLEVKAKFTSGPFMEVTISEAINNLVATIRSMREKALERKELNVDERKPECVKRWPNCCPGEIHPDCCRFPKSCSCLKPTRPWELSSLPKEDQVAYDKIGFNLTSLVKESVEKPKILNMPQAETALERKLAESFELPIELVSEPKITGYITETDIPSGDWRIALSPDLDFVSHDNVNNIYTYLDGETNRFVVVIDNLYVIESDTILDLSDIWDLCRAYEREDTRKRSGRYKARIRKTNSPWRFGWDDN